MLARRDLLKTSVALLALPLAPFGCAEKTGPEPIRADRDACEYCRMLISEIRFATEVRGGPKNDLFKFDDLGCAMHWLKQAGWQESAISEFWVMDYDDGKTWLDARKAHFLVNVRSPMNYNFAGVAAARDQTVPFDEMKRRIAAGSSHSLCPPEGSVALASAAERAVK